MPTVVAVAVVLYVFGVILLWKAEDLFTWWVAEDGPIEWLTFWTLIAAAIWAFAVAVAWRSDAGRRPKRLLWIGIGLLCLFGAMEEISYGQRVFGIPTPEFLMRAAGPEPDLFYNLQGETNFHNLMIAGISVNKVVFGKLLTLATALYLFAVPALSRRKRFAAFFDRHGLPLARAYQVVVLVLAALVTRALTARAGRVAELRELVSCAVFLAILVDPHNPGVAVPASLAATLSRWRQRLAALLPRGPVSRALCVIVSIQLAFATVLRLAFLVVFAATAGELHVGEIRHALYLGLKFDLRLALLICLPFALLSRVPPLNPWRSRGRRAVWLTYFGTVQVLVLLLYFIDFGHYDYLHTRLDAGAVDHVLTAGIALRIVWESYPVIPGLLALGLLTAGYVLLVRRLAFRRQPTPERPMTRRRRILGTTALVVLYLLGIYGKWSWYPLRWSEAFSSPNGFVAALGLNPVLYLIDSIPNRETHYDLDRVRANYDVIADLLEVDPPDPARLSLTRHAEPRERPPFRPNLVVIHLERFASYFTGTFGNRLDSSPEFDRIARDSILFTHFFISAGPTARSVFTMVTGIPDVNPVRSASRSPRLVTQHTLINALEGYDKFYFLGGSATWANIRGLLVHNIQGLQVYEEGDYDAPRIDGWGVSDLSLFEKANEVFSNQDEPFFAFIQTAGNHSPYTIPEDRRGFQLAEIDEETLPENGFHTLTEYNGFRLLDYSLGYFFRLARQAPYFERTVFVMYGDHGSPAPRATPWEQLSLTKYHVPLVIHVPWQIDQPQRIDSVAHLVDVLPTCLSLMGFPYTNTTLGRDLLASRSPERHFAFIGNIGLLTDDYMLQVDKLGNHSLHAYRSAHARDDLTRTNPEEAERLGSLYDAVMETSLYLLYNNPPLEQPGIAPHRAEASGEGAAGDQLVGPAGL